MRCVVNRMLQQKLIKEENNRNMITESYFRGRVDVLILNEKNLLCQRRTQNGNGMNVVWKGLADDSV